MADAKTDTNSSVESLRDDMDKLRQDFAQLSQHLRGAGSEAAETARRRVETTAKQAGDAARENWQQGCSALDTEIRERPLTVLGIAFAAGVVIGRVFVR
ncbi:MAG: hypothetical protein KDA64_17270 [Rhodospirillaceae bacterium]|nr:hypothetical protein [Rhodospirillaceae bacterium]